MEPYVKKPLADEEWLQNYRKDHEDKEGLARELNLSVWLQSIHFAVHIILEVIVIEVTQ